jgi:hypothetical protein
MDVVESKRIPATHREAAQGALSSLLAPPWFALIAHLLICSRGIVQDILDGDGEGGHHERVLVLEEAETHRHLFIHLRDSWRECLIDIGDIIHAFGSMQYLVLTFQGEESLPNKITVSSGMGAVIVNPDMLLSITRVIDSLDCSRRAALRSALFLTTHGAENVWSCPPRCHQWPCCTAPFSMEFSRRFASLIQIYSRLPPSTTSPLAP